MATRVTRETSPARSTSGWPHRSASSLVSAGVGILLLVIGIVALARAGLSDLTAPVVPVGPFTLTPLFALIELALGAIALTTAAERDVGAASALAVVTGVAGIVWLIEPAAFVGVLGTGATTGALYVAISVVLLVSVAMDRRSQPAM